MAKIQEDSIEPRIFYLLNAGDMAGDVSPAGEAMGVIHCLEYQVAVPCAFGGPEGLPSALR